jgi:hypothetical protein
MADFVDANRLNPSHLLAVISENAAPSLRERGRTGEHLRQMQNVSNLRIRRPRRRPGRTFPSEMTSASHSHKPHRPSSRNSRNHPSPSHAYIPNHAAEILDHALGVSELICINW